MLVATKVFFVCVCVCFCRDKTFVATKMILVAASANDSCYCRLVCPSMTAQTYNYTRRATKDWSSHKDWFVCRCLVTARDSEMRIKVGRAGLRH